MNETKSDHWSFRFARFDENETRSESFDTLQRFESHDQFSSKCGTDLTVAAGYSCWANKMENAAHGREDLSDSERSPDEADRDDSMSGASTAAYESNEDVDEYVSDGDGAPREDTTLEDVLGEESAQILRLSVVYTIELRTEIESAQALLNRLRTRLVRHSYGRNTCNREDHLYSLFLYCQTKLEDQKEALRIVSMRLEEVRDLPALQGIDWDE